MFRVGLMAALRSRSLGGKTVGVMITASHNRSEVRSLSFLDIS
jgi:phosphoacetylglucosamine mutase